MDFADKVFGAAIGSSFGLTSRRFYYIENIDYMYEDNGSKSIHPKSIQVNPFDRRYAGYFNTKFTDVVVEDAKPDQVKIAYASQVLFTVPKAQLIKLNENEKIESVRIKQGSFIVIEISWERGQIYEVETIHEKPGYYKLVLKQSSEIGIRKAVNHAKEL